MIRAGRIEAVVFGHAYPVPVQIAVDGTTLRLSHHDLADLQHVLTRAIATARAALPEKDRWEVGP